MPADVSDVFTLGQLTALLPALLPGLLVALLKAADVLLGVMKMSNVVAGDRRSATLFAAGEAAVWLSAAGIVFAEPTPARSIGFVVGMALGTWGGMLAVHLLRLGMVTVRVFVPLGEDRELAGHATAASIRAHGYGATLFEGWGHRGRVDVILSVVRRREAQRVCDAARLAEPAAFVAVDNAPGPGSMIGHKVGSTV